jgi:erythromycin esterase
MKNQKVKWCFLSFIVTCFLFCTLTPPTFADTNEKEMEKWKQWIKTNSYSLEPTKNSRKDHLKFLKKVLKGKRIVQLGETTHGSNEMSATKVELIKYLHEELGYDVLAFESGFAETNGAYRQLHDLSSTELMKRSIFGVWHTQEVADLFKYLQEQEKKGDPLTLTGFDIQVMRNLFTKSTYDWIKQVDSSKADLFKQAEEGMMKLQDQKTEDDFVEKQAIINEQYSILGRFVEEHRRELASFSPQQEQDVDILLQSLKLRKETLMRYSLPNWRFAHGIPIYDAEKHPMVIRDQMMAENLEYLAEKMYPTEKIIVWGHNYHVRKNNSKVKYAEFGQNFLNSMGDYLPDSFRRQTYTIGIYAYSGASLDSFDNKTVKPVNEEKDPTGLEALLKYGNHSSLFVDFLHAPYNKRTSWIYTPRIALYWGYLKEEMILKEQYDGIIWIEHITPAKII